MIRVVVDTNILVSSLLSPKGNEADLILAIQHGVIVPCIMETIVEEYTEVLARRKFKFKPERISSMLEVFREKGQMFEPTAIPYVSPDPTDTKFLQCAFGALADFLVTGNKRHFPASPYGSTHVVSAGELLARIIPDSPISS
jgi:putative PIN family toxin of toxin-antitoxin system